MSADPIARLLEHGEENGCIHLTQLNEVVQALELDEEQIESLFERIDAAGIELTDDCSRVAVAADRSETTYNIDDLSTSTMDALQLFLNEAGRYPLLTAAEEVELAKAIERGDKRAKDKMINSNLRLVVSIAKKLPGPRALAARPDPGGHHRPDPGGREVRLPQGLQVLDLRHLVDPPGRPARRRQQGAHDPDPGAHRRARAEDRPRRARPDREAGARADGRRGLEAGEAAGQAGARGARRRPRGHEPRPAARRRARRRLLRRPVRLRRGADRGGGPRLARRGDAARRRQGAAGARAADPEAALRPRTATPTRSRSRRSAGSWA